MYEQSDWCAFHIFSFPLPDFWWLVRSCLLEVPLSEAKAGEQSSKWVLFP